MQSALVKDVERQLCITLQGVAMADGKRLGIGILGAAAIAKKNVQAIGKTKNGVGEHTTSTPAAVCPLLILKCGVRACASFPRGGSRRQQDSQQG